MAQFTNGCGTPTQSGTKSATTRSKVHPDIKPSQRMDIRGVGKRPSSGRQLPTKLGGAAAGDIHLPVLYRPLTDRGFEFTGLPRVLQERLDCERAVCDNARWSGS